MLDANSPRSCLKLSGTTLTDGERVIVGTERSRAICEYCAIERTSLRMVRQTCANAGDGEHKPKWKYKQKQEHTSTYMYPLVHLDTRW